MRWRRPSLGYRCSLSAKIHTHPRVAARRPARRGASTALTDCIPLAATGSAGAPAWPPVRRRWRQPSSHFKVTFTTLKACLHGKGGQRRKQERAARPSGVAGEIRVGHLHQRLRGVVAQSQQCPAPLASGKQRTSNAGRGVWGGATDMNSNCSAPPKAPARLLLNWQSEMPNKSLSCAVHPSAPMPMTALRLTAPPRSLLLAEHPKKRRCAREGRTTAQ